MWKKALIASAALVLAGSTFVVAQQRFSGPGATRDIARWRPSADDMAAFTDARVAALRAGLRLTPEQDKNWSAFEAALRDFAKLRTERLDALRTAPERDASGDGDNVIARLQQRADILSRRATAFKQLADTAAPLYNSLDDAQKRRFLVLARMLRPRPQFAAWRERGGMHRGGMDRGDMGRGGMWRGMWRGDADRRDRDGFMRPSFGPHGLSTERFGGNAPDEPDMMGPRAAER